MKKLPKLSEKLKKDKKLLLTVAAGILGIVFIVISEFIPKSSYKKAETGEQNKNSVSGGTPVAKAAYWAPTDAEARKCG